MGSEYKILTDSSGKEVSIGEMSNRLELTIFDPQEEVILSTEEMTPKEMLKAFMEGIKSISYYISKEDFDKIFSKLETFAF